MYRNKYEAESLAWMTVSYSIRRKRHGRRLTPTRSGRFLSSVLKLMKKVKR